MLALARPRRIKFLIVGDSLREAFSKIGSRLEQRLFAEYGAIFATRAVPPPRIIFESEDEVARFQDSLDVSRARLGQCEIELQSAAMRELLAAAEESAALGLSITPRGEDAGRRSFAETLALWRRNVTRGLEHWVQMGRISRELARQIATMEPLEQVAAILELEERRGLYFGTYFDKTILSSVAAPGSSQHLSMLAFDVAEYADEAIERVLARHGWHRTVVGDLPHFTFLGYQESELEALGLRRVDRDFGGRRYSFWVPDLSFLSARDR